jgi:hypothetical protein
MNRLTSLFTCSIFDAFSFDFKSDSNESRVQLGEVFAEQREPFEDFFVVVGTRLFIVNVVLLKLHSSLLLSL